MFWAVLLDIDDEELLRADAEGVRWEVPGRERLVDACGTVSWRSGDARPPCEEEIRGGTPASSCVLLLLLLSRLMLRPMA